MIQLSFIVPVFRVEKYLDTCVASLLNQGLSEKEYEIILVDDGSDDACPAMCDRYAEQYGHIHVVHQSNKGLAGARNTGIRVAKGKYICFIDSDDYVEPLSYATLIYTAENDNLDILQYEFRIIYDSYVKVAANTKDCKIYNGDEFLLKKMSERCFCWRYLFRKELITTTATFFSEGILYEDTEWLPRILLQAKSIKQIPNIVYNYVQHEGTITHPKTDADWKKNIEHSFIVMSNLRQIASTAKYSKAWFDAMSSSIITSVLTIVAKHLYLEKEAYIQRILDYSPNRLTSLPSFSTTERIKICLANISLNLYCDLRHYL